MIALILAVLGLALIIVGGWCLWVMLKNAKDYNDEHDLP